MSPIDAAAALPQPYRTTGFFQPAHVYSALEQHILPSLVAFQRPGRPLRFWVPDCGVGHDLYSLSILVSELLPSVEVTLLGSDGDLLSVVQARYGLFHDETMSTGLSRAHRERFFRPVGPEWQLTTRERERCQVQLFDLGQGWPRLPSFDLILLPRGLESVAAPLRPRVLEALRDQLAPHGRLVMDQPHSGLEGTRTERFGEFRWLKRDLSSDPRPGVISLLELDSSAR